MLMKLINKPFDFSMILLSSVLFSFSQESNTIEPIVTDRPDQTEASSTVGKSTIQIETGLSYESFKNHFIQYRNYTYNTTLIRYGILDNVELRLGWDFVEGKINVNGNNLETVASGFSPLLVGLKIDITEEKNGLPEIALVGHIFPIFSASEDYRPETTGVDFRLSFSHTLSEKSSLGYNLGAEWGNDSPEAVAIYTIVYGYSISNAFGIYAELYGDIPEDNSANQYWNAGFTYLASKDLQFDISVGTSVTEGQDLLLGMGLSYRIRKALK